MADKSVPQLSTLINQQITDLDTLDKLLSQAQALTHITLEDGFFELPQWVMHSLMWLLDDVIGEAKKLNEKALDVLLMNAF